MITCEYFYNQLSINGIKFFTGVPDSVLKEFCNYLSYSIPQENHIISANEGNAVAIACGHHLASGEIPLIYMQNSGLGNCVNPLLSLADKSVYSIPMLLVIGWRGEPGVKDEPQHMKQGELTLGLLELMNIPYEVISPSDDNNSINKKLNDLVTYSRHNNSPATMVIKKGVFESQEKNKDIEANLGREQAIKFLVNKISSDDIIISTTGKISRESYEYLSFEKQSLNRLFMSVGSMGHASQIALGIANNKRDKNVFCFDGDGAVLMHMGGLGTISARKLKNYKHVVFNNGVHDSVGGQPTSGVNTSFADVAKACGYVNTFYVDTETTLASICSDFINSDGPSLLEIKVSPGARADLGRPVEQFDVLKDNFMRVF
jgi:phosphonopyruvate decarboxylase